MAKLELQPGERIRMNGVLPYLKYAFYQVAGVGILTSRRFVHMSVGRSWQAQRLLRNIEVNEAKLDEVTFVGVTVDIDVPLDAITSLSQGSGRKRDVLTVTSSDGRQFRLRPGPAIVEWFQAFGRGLASEGAATLRQHGPLTWTVERP